MEDDEIIIGVQKPKTNKTNSKKKKKNKKKAKKINKKKNEKKLKTLKIIAILIVFIIAIVLLLSSNLFNINKINVEGNSILSDDKIVSISSLELHTNIFKFNKLTVKNKIMENAYVESVKITRKIPSTIEIQIEERVPTYMLQFADSYVYINNQGYMLEISNKKLDVPILTGFTTDLSNIKEGNRICEEDLERMKMVIKIYQALNNNEIANIVSKIDMSNEKNYTIFFESEGKKVYLGDGSDLSTKIVCLKSILEASSGKNGEIFLNVDLNTEKAYFRESVE